MTKCGHKTVDIKFGLSHCVNNRQLLVSNIYPNTTITGLIYIAFLFKCGHESNVNSQKCPIIATNPANCLDNKLP